MYQQSMRQFRMVIPVDVVHSLPPPLLPLYFSCLSVVHINMSVSHSPSYKSHSKHHCTYCHCTTY